MAGGLIAERLAVRSSVGCFSLLFLPAFTGGVIETGQNLPDCFLSALLFCRYSEIAPIVSLGRAREFVLS